MTGPGAFLEELTWPEAEAWFKAGRVVLLPIGAASKEHGHHLPLNTDWIVSRALAERVAAALPVLVAPVIGFGYYPAFVNYPGSQHLQADSFIALMRDLIGNLIDHGVQRIAVLNGGVSTEAPLALVLREVLERRGVRVASAHIRELGRKAHGLLQQRSGGHADEAETSIMLALKPAAVRLHLAQPDYGDEDAAPATVFRRPVTLSGRPDSGIDHSLTGATGDPTLATAAKGEALLAEMTRELVDGLRQLWPEVTVA
jgi:creatinine amidohydrolase